MIERPLPHCANAPMGQTYTIDSSRGQSVQFDAAYAICIPGIYNDARCPRH
jgi:hypothetical protein